jgi:hypothetical protein
MSNFNVPTRDEVSENNRHFDNPGCWICSNIYAAMGHSKTLGSYMQF